MQTLWVPCVHMREARERTCIEQSGNGNRAVGEWLHTAAETAKGVKRQSPKVGANPTKVCVRLQKECN